VGSARPYGARRVWRDVLAEGIDCGLYKVERLMKAQALRARPRRRALPKDEGQRLAAAPNVLDREFHAGCPNQRWIADFILGSSPRTGSMSGPPKAGFTWRPSSICSHAVSWASSQHLLRKCLSGKGSVKAEMTAQRVTDALVMAIWRSGKPDALLHHSDQGLNKRVSNSRS
jgi:putative transposase